MNWKDAVLMGVLFLLPVLFGCQLRPNVNAGYYLDLKPESKGSVTIGSNGVQSNAIHASIAAPGSSVQKQEAADGATKGDTASAGALFSNNGQFSRSSDTDLSGALEILSEVKGATAGQSQTRDTSPITSTQSPTTSNTESKTTELNTPVSVTKTGTAASSTGGAAQATPATETGTTTTSGTSSAQ